MNPTVHTIRIGSFLPSGEGWGQRAGNLVRAELIDYIAAQPDVHIFRLSMEGLKRIDVAFAYEAIVSLVGEYRTRKAFCIVDLVDPDVLDTLAAAAERMKTPVLISIAGQAHVLGMRESSAAHEALAFASERSEVRASDFAAATGMSISNASSRFNELWSLGLLLRSQDTASSGGSEYRYQSVA